MSSFTLSLLRSPPFPSPSLSLPKRQRSFSLSFPPLPLHSNRITPSHHPPSLRHFNKHLSLTQPKASFTLPSFTLPSFTFPSIEFTPLTITKLSFYLSLFVFTTKTILSLLTSPFFWTNLSVTFIFYPWLIALSLALYSLYCLFRKTHLSLFDQSVVATSAVAWLTVVPAACSNGFLEGWPVAFFFIYIYFLLFECSVRRRLYVNLNIPKHDPKWDINLPKSYQISFAISILIGHWLAAFEGPELSVILSNWANLGIWVLVLAVFILRYHSVLYLSKYSENVVVPINVVRFGPYRFVRHPIYASVMLLFVANCVALRAPLSCIFLLGACLVYYGRKGEMEERVMIGEFGEGYRDYMSKVKHRLIPFVY